MHTLTQNFNRIVVVNEKSKDVEIMKIEELQGSLEAKKLKLIQRNKIKEADQALQAQVKGNFAKWKGKQEQGKISKRNWNFNQGKSKVEDKAFS